MATGAPIRNWFPRPLPPRTPMQGRWCSVVALDPALHARALFDADRENRHERWTYLGADASETWDEYSAWMTRTCLGDDPMFHAILDVDGRPVGIAAYLRIDPAMGSIEVGHINYTTSLQRTPAATEAMFLMLRRAFDELGYRRYEWKCDSLNEPSRAAAARLGFTFEGVFRQHMVYKGRNRDTAWYSITDAEWPALRTRFKHWLMPDNFDAVGHQIARLGEQAGSPR